MRLRRFLVLTVFLFVFATGVLYQLSSKESSEEATQEQAAVQNFGSAVTLDDGNDSIPDAQDQGESELILSPAKPSSIDLGFKLEQPAEFKSQYERWQDGDIDLGKIESFVSESQREFLVGQSQQLEPDEAIQDLDMAQSASSVLELGFDSLDISQCCGAEGANVPPDPELAVGPEHVIAAVNVAFEIYDKSGAVLIPATTYAALFSGVDGCTSALFDPNVLYDERADRFILAIDGDGKKYCLAVSQSNDPTGEWWRYSFPANQNNLSFDYPQAGVGRNAIYMGGNMFIPGAVSNPFAEARVWAFDKWAMYAGNEAEFRTHVVRRSTSNPAVEDTPQPANLHGYRQGTWPDSGPHYFLTGTNFNGATYSVFQWIDPFGENKFSYVGTFDLEQATGINIGMPVPVRQDNSLIPLLTNDWRLQDAEYRNGTIWTTDTVACNRDGQVVNCIRWAQIEPETAKVLQAGVTTGDGAHRFFGDLAANSCNDMAIGYTKMADNGFPGISISGRIESQPPGLLHGEIELKAGELAYVAFDGPDTGIYRWGDYTGMTSDPNGRDFWYIGQYSKDTQDPFGRWGTHIGCFVATSCRPKDQGNLTQQNSSVTLPEAAYTVTMPIVSRLDYFPCGSPLD